MLNRAFREEAAGLSSGKYYDEIHEWYSVLLMVLNKYGFDTNQECPQVYNCQGRSVVYFEDDNGKCHQIFWTYYRMQSFRWEIVCYVC